MNLTFFSKSVFNLVTRLYPGPRSNLRINCVYLELCLFVLYIIFVLLVCRAILRLKTERCISKNQSEVHSLCGSRVGHLLPVGLRKPSLVLKVRLAEKNHKLLSNTK